MRLATALDWYCLAHRQDPGLQAFVVGFLGHCAHLWGEPDLAGRCYEEMGVLAALREARAASGSIESLRSTLLLYRGDFLEEETISDWHLEIRDRLRRLYIEGLFAPGELLMQAQRYAEAIEVYQRIVRKEDLQEEAHRRLMLCRARAGDRASALRQYERLLVLLREELDSEPDAETTALYERLRRAEPV